MGGNTGTATNARPPDGGTRRRGARAGAAGRELGSADRAARRPRPPRSWDRWLLGGGRVATAELAPVGWAAHLVPRLGHVRWLRHRPRSAGLWGDATWWTIVPMFIGFTGLFAGLALMPRPHQLAERGERWAEVGFPEE